jgi:flagellar basal-body rod modification protein FlgD
MTTIVDNWNNQTQATTNPVGSIVKPDGAVTDKNPNDLSDKDAFLKLLVAQLKYQDPSNPADTSEMMSQTAQFTQVEALNNLQKQQTQMLQSTQSTQAAGLIGKTITGTPTLGGADVTGVVTGVKLGTDGPVVKIGDKEVNLSSVKEVVTSSSSS